MKLPRKLEIPLMYALYWTLGCLFLGILFAPAVRTFDADPSADRAHDHAHLHSQVEVDPDNAPEVSIEVVKDALVGWNVYVAVENFRFAPERVNQANIPNEGHAHLYLNGKKGHAALRNRVSHVGIATGGERRLGQSKRERPF